MPVTKLTPENNNLYMQERMEALMQAVPEAFADGKINWETLRELLGEELEEGGREEYFGLNWPGKREARRKAAIPSRGTLVPVYGEGVNEDRTENLFIEGNNLEVLKLLQKSYAGKIKMIYIDPPYNTGNDFIYNDDFTDPLEAYLRYTGAKGEGGELLTTNTRADGRFHSKWLNMMYPRILLSKQLLRDDGFFFVSISEEEVSNIRLLLNEIYGEENFRNAIAVRRFDKNISTQFLDRGLTSLSVGFEYILVYSKKPDSTIFPVFREASAERSSTGYWKGFWNAANRPTMRYELFGFTPETGQWKWKKDKALEAVDNYKTYLSFWSDKKTLEEHWIDTGKNLSFIRHNPTGTGMNKGVEHWIPPSDGILRSSNWTDIIASATIQNFGLEFSNPKNVSLIEQIVLMGSDDGDIIIDFFAGSGTTGHAILKTNLENNTSRKFILIQIPEIIDDSNINTVSNLSKQRIKSVIEELNFSVEQTKSSLFYDEEEISKIDLGFKVLRFDQSNFKLIDPSEIENVDNLNLFFSESSNPLILNWKKENLISELLLLEGFPLTSTMTYLEDFHDNELYNISAPDWCTHELYICLDAEIHNNTIRHLEMAEDDIFICLDSALTDELKVRIQDKFNVHVI